MSDFYAVLADHYDALFGCDEATDVFLESEGATPASTVLDVACGTGACTRRLLARGVDAYGVDLATEMIDRARRYAAQSGLDPNRFVAADMLKVDRHIAAPFNLIFCIGNSIAHLPGFADVERFLAAASRSLTRPGGRIILQYVDAGIREGESSQLPDLTAPGVRMLRVYHRISGSRIRFDASLLIDGSPQQHVSQYLIAIPAEQLREALTRAGFTRITLFGGFDRSPATAGWVRVVIAHLP